MGTVYRFVTHLLRLHLSTTMWRIHRGKKQALVAAVPMSFEAAQ
jgi:hypothetical protein